MGDPADAAGPADAPAADAGPRPPEPYRTPGTGARHGPDPHANDGTRPAPPTRRILLDPAGPVLVEGPVEVVLPDGRTERCDRFMAALCTCHRSQTFPWCDTSHRRRAAGRATRAAADDDQRPRRAPTGETPEGSAD